MSVAGTSLKLIVICSASVAISSGINAPCSTGTRVYDLTVWSGHWLDGLVMRCTGDSEDNFIPPEFNEYDGGDQAASICGGTGGVQSMEWGVPEQEFSPIVYFNVTCLDNQTHHFSNGKSYDIWNITSNRTVSCEEEKYVQGITYTLDYQEDGDYPYFFTSLGFICSSSTLDAICTDCGDDTVLKSDEDQPEYCELPTCSETECCEPKDDEESESTTTTIIIGVISSVVAAMIISASAWMHKKFKQKNDTADGVAVFAVEDQTGVS